MKSVYKFLVQFSHGTTPCRTHLIHKFGEELLEECLGKGYIIEFGENSVGDTLYTITEEGKRIRDN